MKFNLKCFGVLAEKFGTEISVDDSEISTIFQLKEKITTQFPELSQYNFKLAKNKFIADDLSAVDSSDELVLLPPFSGG